MKKAAATRLVRRVSVGSIMLIAVEYVASGAVGDGLPWSRWGLSFGGVSYLVIGVSSYAGCSKAASMSGFVVLRSLSVNP